MNIDDLYRPGDVSLPGSARLLLWAPLMILGTIYLLLAQANWTGDDHLHTLTESMSTFVAFVVGAVAWLRYNAKHNQLDLFVCIGFTGTGILDAYHTLVTSNFLSQIWPSSPTELIPLSWNLSRLFIAVLLALSLAIRYRERAGDETVMISPRRVSIIAVTVCVVLATLLSLTSFLQFDHPGLVSSQPQELLPALLYIGVFFGFLKCGRWRQDPFEHSLMVSVLIASIGQLLDMPLSHQWFDPRYFAAHLLKIASYLTVLTGLLLSIAELYRRQSDTLSNLEEMAMAVNSVADSIVIYERNWKVRFVNEAYKRHTGWTGDSWKGKYANQLQSSETYEEIGDTLARGETWSGSLETELRNGKTVLEEATVSPIIDDTGGISSYVSVIRDKTEQVRLEQQLSQAQKLESIGQLAAGIAHEINTPTQYIGDNTRFVKDAFEEIQGLINRLEELASTSSGSVPAEKIAEILEDSDIEFLMSEIPGALGQSLEGVERVARIVRAMKDFSHPAQEKTEIDLNAAIQSTITVATNEWKYVAEMKTDLDQTLPQVHCLPGELNQVILNMIVNAAHAVEEQLGTSASRKGCIEITTRHLGDLVRIRIKDNGAGMAEEVRSRIFDPFYTTKEVGKGTGQGLAISHDVIINKHNGQIKVESEPDHGTCFTIDLPLQQSAQDNSATTERERACTV